MWTPLILCDLKTSTDQFLNNLALLCQGRREREERAQQEAIQREKEGETQISLLEQLSVLAKDEARYLGYVLYFSSCGENCVIASPGAGVCA